MNTENNMVREFKMIVRNGDLNLSSRYAYKKGEAVEFTAWELLYDGDDIDDVKLLMGVTEQYE